MSEKPLTEDEGCREGEEDLVVQAENDDVLTLMTGSCDLTVLDSWRSGNLVSPVFPIPVFLMYMCILLHF